MITAFVVAGLSGELAAQSRVFVEHELGTLPVISMDGNNPVVEIQGRRKRVDDGRVSMEPASAFTDGAIEILKKDAMMGQDYGSDYGGLFFRFDAQVRAERDFEDCFILFAIAPSQGKETYMLREIPDINAVGNDRILITIPVSPSLGGGTFGFKLYSKGEEIELLDNNELVSIREILNTSSSGHSTGPLATREQERESYGTIPAELPSDPPEVTKSYLPNFPQSLVGVMDGGYVEVLFTIGENGRALEILNMRGEHPDLLPEAQKTVIESHYRPGIYGGKAIAATVQQRIFFNEFASFPEELEVVSYPSYRDRIPVKIYSPLPQSSTGEIGEIEIEVLVDRLGRPVSSEINSSSSEALSADIQEAVSNWIFLPAIQDGYPVESTITLPISYR